MTFINKDFRIQEPKKRHPGLRWLMFFTGCAVLGVVIANTADDTTQTESLASFTQVENVTQAITEQSSDIRTQKSIALNLPALPEKPSDTINLRETPEKQSKILSLPELPVQQSVALTLPDLQAKQDVIDDIKHEAPKKWREFKVKSGDSLALLFKRANIQAKQLDEIMKSGEAVKQLKKIFPDDTIRVLTDDEGELQALHYEIDHASYLQVERKDDGLLESSIQKHNLEKRTTHASGEIQSSLFLAAARAGVSQNIIMELAGIFGWDIDFVLDIRKGDSFAVVYEQLYRDGEKIADGEILSAEFINKGTTYQAVRYTNPETEVSEYFTADGKSMRKAFLRSPVNFTRISSGFTINRYHPILHKFRSHKGVDYAAKRGTPVVTAGDGKITFKGKKGGYGRTIIVQHGTKYSTLYAHLNSYNKKLKVGSKVKQGQTIGYVGSSGLATGPHLHYEFRLAGVHRNPLTVELPAAEPVPKRLKEDFERVTAPRLAQLELLTRTQIALNDSSQ